MSHPPTTPEAPKSGRRPAIRDRARVGGSVREQRSPKALAVSVLLHLAVAFVVVQVLTFGHGLSGFLDFGKEEKLEERLTYVATEPKQPEPTPVKPTTPPVARTPRVSTPASGAQVEGPIELPAASAPVARADTGSGGSTAGTGNGVGAVDPNVRGVKPEFGDPRVWRGPVGNGVAPGRDGIERLDSIIGYSITAARDSLDSLARAQGKYDRAPGDWTKTDKNGKKWGWDQQGIRLGKVTIPNALLGLLPLNAATAANMSGNYTSMSRERQLSAARADILRMSERAQGETEFRKIANELRDRRERERRDRLKAPSASVAPAAPVPAKDPPKGGGNKD
jgi:hypothetical protein